MWIVNQDKIAVVEADALALDPADIKQSHKVRLWASTADHDYLMGVYNSIDEAINVLDDFKSSIIKGAKVFVMPKATAPVVDETVPEEAS